MTTRCKTTGTAISAFAWSAACAYLYLAWPSLSALLETLDEVPEALPDLPRIAFPAIGLAVVVGLALKDRCMSAPLAIATDAVLGAPAFALIALLLEPFFVPVE